MIAGDQKQFGFKDGTNALFDHPDGIICLDDSKNPGQTSKLMVFNIFRFLNNC